MSIESVGVNNSSFEGSALAPLITPHILLPSQYAELQRAVERSPERRLYLAILEDAIDCWLRGGPTVTHAGKKKQGVEAERWIWGDGGLINFSECCEVLGIAPEWLRGKLEAKRKERPVKMPGTRHAVRREGAGLGWRGKGRAVEAATPMAASAA